MPDDNKLEPGQGAEAKSLVQNGDAEDLPTRLAEGLPPSFPDRAAEPEEPISNPELEAFFRALAKVLEERAPAEREPPSDATSRRQPEEVAAGQVATEPPAAESAAVPAAPAPAPPVVSCRNCGQQNPAGNRFCGSCGTDLGKPPAPTAKMPAVTARKEMVTTLGLQASYTGASGRAEPTRERQDSSQRNYWLLGLLLLLLVLLGFQQWQLWHMQRFIPGWWSKITGSQAETSAPRGISDPAQLAIHPAPTPAPLPASSTGARAARPPAMPTPSAKSEKTNRAVPATVTVKNSLASAPIESSSVSLSAPQPTESSGSSAQQPEKAISANPVPPQPERVRISADAARSRLIHKVSPEYPTVALNARIQGAVVLQAIIGKDGTIQRLRVVSGNPLLVGAALEAVKQWRYQPYTLNGQPVEVETTVTMNFANGE